VPVRTLRLAHRGDWRRAPENTIAAFTAARGGFIPEGVEYDKANGRFLTGSLAEGSIFTIGRDGAVMSAMDGGSDLPDATVKACVVRAFYGVSFPQPEGGIVQVTYPIVFSHE
jgi:hypothetical protein